MKTAKFLAVLVTGFVLIGPSHSAVAADKPKAEADAPTYSSLDLPRRNEPADMDVTFDNVLVRDVLTQYQAISGRALIVGTNIPQSAISFKTQQPLTRRELLQALDSVLAQHGVVMIPQGTKFVKAVPFKQVMGEAVEPTKLTMDQLPESSSYVMVIVEVEHRSPRELAQALQPMACLPNSIVAIDSQGLLVLRDFSANVRRMLHLVRSLDTKEVKSFERSMKKSS